MAVVNTTAVIAASTARRTLRPGAGHHSSAEVNAVAYRDVLMNTVLGLVMMIAVIFLMIKVETAKATAQAEPPGNLMVNITWPEGDTDVDLWVTGPGEPVPVGYSNKGGVLWNLLRDDLGNWPDATKFNYESAYTHGIVPGTYWINVMCFTCKVFPVPVDVEITLNTGKGEKDNKTQTRVLLTTQVVLTKPGQERTAVSFKMDSAGNVDDASLNSIYRPLRSAKKG